ncbi:hypothetical protein [Cryptosporangium minutisporangium]|uniref:SH3 domain-containing protein n=1 Tax=Cryptosporangium minutisporangium TaxID=113569 RepID=A0ABP6SXV7_9ACTN
MGDRGTRTGALISAFALAGALGAVVVPETVAAADRCNHARGPGGRTDGGFVQDNVTMYKGPGFSCDVKSTGDRDDDLTYICYASNDTSGTWTYLYNRTQNVRGWVKDSYLLENGSYDEC